MLYWQRNSTSLFLIFFLFLKLQVTMLGLTSLSQGQGWIYDYIAQNMLNSSAVERSFVRLAGAVGRQSALHKENSGFATLHQSFFYSFITILPSESGVALDPRARLNIWLYRSKHVEYYYVSFYVITNNKRDYLCFYTSSFICFLFVKTWRHRIDYSLHIC
jgi:hypothetical protein